LMLESLANSGQTACQKSKSFHCHQVIIRNP
jgi:hypothetical protein